MADEQAAEGEGEAKKGGGDFIFRIAILALVLIVPIAAAVVTYKLVVERALADSNPRPIEETPEQDLSMVVNYEFDQQFADLTPSNPEYPAATLAFQVGFECLNPETAALIELHKGRFAAIITDKHGHHTRDEANERLLQQSIEQQILIEANALLKRYSSNADIPLKVLDVYHIGWFVRE